MNNLLNSNILNNPGLLVGIVAAIIVVFAIVFLCVVYRKKIAAFFKKGKDKSDMKKVEKQGKQDYAGDVFANRGKGIETNNDVADRMSTYGKLTGSDMKMDTKSSGPKTAEELLAEKENKKNAKQREDAASSAVLADMETKLKNKELTATVEVEKSKMSAKDIAEQERAAQATIGSFQNKAYDAAKQTGASGKAAANSSADEILASTAGFRNTGLVTDTKGNTKAASASERDSQDTEDLEKIDQIVKGLQNTGKN